MGLTLSLADAVLKEDYKGPLRKQINDRVKFISQLETNTEDFAGRRAIVPCHVGRNSGIGSRKEGETLPTAGNQTTVDAIIGMKYHYGRVKLSAQVIAHMAKDRGAFVRAMKLEMEGLVADITRDRARQAWGASNGVIATCGTTSTSTTVQLATTTPESILVGLREGAVIDIGTSASPGSVATSRTVTAVDLTNKTITISGAAVSTSSSNFVSRAGSGGTGSDQRELTGWQSLCGTGTVQSIDPSTYPSWASIVDTNSGTTRPFTEALVEKTSHRAENLSGKVVSTMYAEDGVYRAIAQHLKAYQRIVNKVTLNGGHQGVSFSFGGTEDVTLVRDRDCPPGTLNGYSPGAVSRYVLEDWTWEDRDGSTLRLSTDSTHTFEAIYYGFDELAIHHRNAVWRIEDLEQV
jgi:hypothetical protein